ncbi:MAG TPA: ATP-binding protein [Usitatibacter sp.]|nr:ATP-binding protein [Usitatibacter sp.]
MRRKVARRHYTIALVALGIATLARWAAGPVVGEYLPFAAYFLAVVVVAWTTSLGPAVLTLVAGAVLGETFFRPAPASSDEVGVLARFLLLGGAAVAAFETLNFAHRRADEYQALLTTLMDQIHDYAIFLVDLEGRPVTWNQGVKRVLGYDQDEFIGRDVRGEIFTPEDIALGVPDTELAVAARAGRAMNDRWMRRKDGTRFFATGVTVARRDELGRTLGYAKIMRDQTEDKHLEEELRETAQRLARANEQQSHFLAMLSHELRNPLAPIRNGVEILKLSGRSAAEGSRALDMISRQVSQLVRLIDDLLDVNRIRGGKVHLRKSRVDLRECLAEAIDIAHSQAAANGQRVSIDLPATAVWVEADPTRLTQVVSNLVHNACKFTPRGGSIHLSARATGGSAEIRVRDTGRGIPRDRLEHIFGLFEQLEGDPGTVQGGLGIGLSLSRSLVEMHGGSLEAHSDGPGKGSEFVVRIPLSEAPAESTGGERVQPAAARHKVLVVDDNLDAAESLATVVRLSGHDVVCAHDGEEALEKAAQHDPDIVLLDIGLPKLDGYQVARRLRAGANGRGLKLIAITGWGQEEDVAKARQAGFDRHVTKPIDYPALLEILG